MRTILHSDLNNFFASVECSLDPSLAGHPVAVAGDPASRHGIILAKNELAKRYGVATGEALWEARMKCPEIIFVRPHYEKYSAVSSSVRSIYNEYTDLVEPFGMDECWLDVTGSKNLFGNGSEIADEIRRRVRSELGVTVSVGVSFNKVFAKLGSDMKKPDATTVIGNDDFQSKIWHLPVSELLFVGRKTRDILVRYGIKTIGDIARTDVRVLESLLGKSGRQLHSYANGLDSSPVNAFWYAEPPKSVSCGNTTPRDLVGHNDVKIALYALCDNVACRLKKINHTCRTVSLAVRDKNLRTYVRQSRLDIPSNSASEIFKCAFALFCTNDTGIPVRTLTVTASELYDAPYQQLSLLGSVAAVRRSEQLERTADSLREKYGAAIIRRAVSMTDEIISLVRTEGQGTEGQGTEGQGRGRICGGTFL